MNCCKGPIVTVVLATLSAVLLSPNGVYARVPVHPALFAVSSSMFPAQSKFVRSGVETNRQLQSDDAAHFGLPPGVIGRISGYYVDAHDLEQVDAGGYTSYLVSIFRSAREAQRAYDYRWDTWFDDNYHSVPAALSIHVGDRDAAALFDAIPPEMNHLTELLFRRGAVLVEVFQYAASDALRSERRPVVFAIATALDRIAVQHRHG